MEKQNSPKNERRLNYQILQAKKEQQLTNKVNSLTVSIGANDVKIAELEKLIQELSKENEQVLATIKELQSRDSKDIKERKEKLAVLEQERVAVSASLSESEASLQKIIDTKLKEAQDSPRALEIKSRLAYLNAEINDSNFKIGEYRKEAKREQSLKGSIEKLKKEEVRLETLIASGTQNLKHNYEDELYVAKTQREDTEKQLQNFLTAENEEIATLTNLIAEMGREATELNAELDKLRQSQENATVAMGRIEDDSAVKALRTGIASTKQQLGNIDGQLGKLAAELNEIKNRELEAAKAQGKEQEYLAAATKLTTSENRVKEIAAEIAKSEKEIAGLKETNEKLSARQKEAALGVTECLNYNDWVKNNKKFSEQMYPTELELAVSDYRADKQAATEEVMPQLEAEVRKELEKDIPEFRRKAEETVSDKRFLPKAVKEKIANNLTERLINFRVEKDINDSIESGKNETWNKRFKKIRDERQKNLETTLSSAEKRYFVDKNNSEAKATYEQAKLALEMFAKAETDTTLLVVKNVRKYFPVERSFFGKPTRYLKAVDDVSFLVKKGKTLGIVGESGCGKTTMGRTMLRLHEITDGQIIFDGNHLESLKNKGMRPLRTELQIIFQDPYSSLSPRLPVGEIIGEAVKAHKIVPNSEYKDYIIGVMKSCGLQPHHYSRFPHEFSGGQRQRICIARALAVNPKVVICDEPVSALDVSIQAQIINLLKDLQETRNLTYIFISHDLSVVEHISDDVGVMYLGSMVESGSKERIFDNPMHPYTEALLSAVPVPDPNVKMNRIYLQGDIPSPSRPPRGCKFHTRCHKCMEICKTMPPVYREYEEGHFVACHLYPQD